MFDVTKFKNKVKSNNGLTKLDASEWNFIVNKGLNSSNSLLKDIKGNWYKKAIQNNCIEYIEINLYFIHTYLIRIDEANFNSNNNLLLKPHYNLIIYNQDLPLYFKKNFNIWKHYLNYGIKVDKITRDCRQYTEYTPTVYGMSEISINLTQKGLIELEGVKKWMN